MKFVTMEDYLKENLRISKAIRGSMEEMQQSIDEINTYKASYELLTDGVDTNPQMLRASVQGLFSQATDTSIINAEAFVDEWTHGSPDHPIEHQEKEIRKYKGQVYECFMNHTDHGEPDRSPDVFKTAWRIKHTKDRNNPKPYVKPTGDHDAYQTDEVVIYLDGFSYVSKVDANVYTPEEYPDNWEKLK